MKLFKFLLFFASFVITIPTTVLDAAKRTAPDNHYLRERDPKKARTQENDQPEENNQPNAVHDQSNVKRLRDEDAEQPVHAGKRLYCEEQKSFAPVQPAQEEKSPEENGSRSSDYEEEKMPEFSLEDLQLNLFDDADLGNDDSDDDEEQPDESDAGVVEIYFEQKGDAYFERGLACDARNSDAELIETEMGNFLEQTNVKWFDLANSEIDEDQLQALLGALYNLKFLSLQDCGSIREDLRKIYTSKKAIKWLLKTLRGVE